MITPTDSLRFEVAVTARASGRLNAAYLRAIEDAGLVARVVAPLDQPAQAGDVIAGVAGLVLTGGADIDPSRYGAARHTATHGTSAARDESEIALLQAARARAMPTLAICRGMQLLNVALGGTLVQDIPSELPGAMEHEPRRDRVAGERRKRTHDVHVQAGSRLAIALGATSLRVNSFHHQALREVADGLSAVARSPDGVIEGVESVDAGWPLLAVQWHPEELTDTDEAWDRSLFTAFAGMVRTHAGRHALAQR